MGTCCASRTDMAGKDKGGKNSKAAGGATPGGAAAAGGKSKAGVTFNPMDSIRNTVMQLLQDSKCCQ